jgi:NAD(P)-dependent dehydrogenase (short-subunit alcohol dehydrogenase family)
VTSDDFLRLGGARVLVTGASSGIGAASALAAARHGASVALVARNDEKLRDLARTLPGSGHVVIRSDLSDLGGIAGVVAQARDRLGGELDGLVHAAGVQETTPVRSLSAEALQQMLTTNVASAVMLAKEFRRRGVHGDPASIVLMSSVMGLVGQPGFSAYSASKAAIVGLTRSLALEFARDSIRVNCLCPGIVTTPMSDAIRDRIGEAAFANVVAAHPLGLGAPGDVADAALFLLSPASRWMTGSALTVDGGYTAQ